MPVVERVRRRARPAARRELIADRDRDLDPRRDAARRGGHARSADVLGPVARRDVARADHGREPQLPLALGQPAQPQVDRDPRDQRLVRRQVADRLGEDVGAVLLEERRGVARRDRALEPLAGLLLAVDPAGDRAIGELERVAADRAVGRQRHPVGHVQRLGVAVLEPLLQHQPRDAAARGAAQPRRHQRQRPAVRGDDLGAGGAVGVRGGGVVGVGQAVPGTGQVGQRGEHRNRSFRVAFVRPTRRTRCR